MRKFIFITIALLILVTPTLALKETTTYLPAVEETKYGYQGVLATLTVNIKEGKGRVYVDTWPLTKIDTQASARIAKEVACDLLHLSCDNYDFFYTIRSESPIVGGPSGGAAFTIATLASLLDLNLSKGVFITGTINLDGSIGKIGGVLEKAEAVSKGGGKLFLIPVGNNIVEKEKIENESIGGIITINKITPEKIELDKYAKEHWNLSVKEVRTIQEAFKYFTGYEIKEPKLEFKRTKKYQEVMKKVADDLIERAKELKENCEEKLKNAKITYDQEKQISELCGKSLEKAEESYNKKNYYSAASLAFSNSLSYRYGEKLIDFLSSDDKRYFLRNYLKSIEEKIFKPNTSNIELYAIIEERLSETQEKLDEGWKNYYNGNYIQSLNYGAFAEERLFSAEIWRKYADEFPAYIENMSSYLKEVSNNLLSETSSLITYSSLTSQNEYIDYAKKYLERARLDYRDGNYYSSIINCLKSQVNAELASEILFGDEDYLIEIHKERALVEINKTNSIIGQSYFEYARTLEKENPEVALIYYTYAEKLSKLSEILNKKPKKEVIIPENYIKKVGCDYEEIFYAEILFLIVAFFIGYEIGKKW